MENNSALLYASLIDGVGKGDVLTDDSISAAVKGDTLSWVHLDGNHTDTKSWLEKEISYLDHIIIDALLADETRPRIMEFENGALMILRGVNLNKDAEPEDMVSVRLWIDQNRIISIQRRPLKAIKDIQARLNKGNGPKNSGDFITMLTAHLFDRMEPIFTELDENLDDIEERVMEAPDTKERQEITTIRKQAILFRRYIAPQRDVIAHLRTSEQPWLDHTQKRHLQESFDRVVRYVEDLDTIRERAQIVKDELTSALADKMNNNMYVLSIVAAIFLPLGFLTGLMGINVGGMPGVENDIAFWIVCALCVAFMVFIGGVFKFLKWV